jgi:hypothetical protein
LVVSRIAKLDATDDSPLSGAQIRGHDGHSIEKDLRWRPAPTRGCWLAWWPAGWPGDAESAEECTNQMHLPRVCADIDDAIPKPGEVRQDGWMQATRKKLVLGFERDVDSSGPFRDLLARRDELVGVARPHELDRCEFGRQWVRLDPDASVATGRKKRDDAPRTREGIYAPAAGRHGGRVDGVGQIAVAEGRGMSNPIVERSRGALDPIRVEADPSGHRVSLALTAVKREIARSHADCAI